MKPELRVVTSYFAGKHLGKEPSATEDFAKGDVLIVYTNDGAHVTFVRSDDKKKERPFTAQTDDFEASTKLVLPPR